MSTIKDVATLANVSPSTVSRVISGHAYVDEKTKARVLEAIAELDYQPNVLAKALKEGYTGTIALVVPNIQNQIFPLILRGVEDTARKNGFTVIFCNTDEDELVEKSYINKLQKRSTDGFILATALSTSAHIIELRNKGVPVVLVARSMEDKVDAVIIDNYKVGREATEYLIKTGHKRIGIACGRFELSIYRDRYRGYCDALKCANIEFDSRLVMQETNGTNSLYALTHKMLERGTLPDAVFCTSDPKAIVVMRSIKDFGLRVPDDISVIGVDNVEISSLVEPPLTTISQPLYEMGAMAAKKLITIIRSKTMSEPIVDILNTDLIIRKSTR